MACSQCAAEHDASESASTLERIRYFPRQLLTADDMRTEQEYFREKHRRHNRFLHGFGVVCGLLVVPDPQQGAMAINVCPGYALGPYGDEIYVEEPVPFDLTYCAQPRKVDCQPAGGVVQPIGAPKILQVKIRYAECPSRPMRTLPAGCGCDETACEYSRTRDGFEIRCNIKPTNQPAVAVQQPLQAAPACLPCPAEPWILLAEVHQTANGLNVLNNVRRVVPNTPALRGF
jgi:hypothetical protein